MHNGFSCYNKREGSDSDKKISVVLQIDDREEGIELNISRNEAVKTGASFSTRISNELTLTALSVDQVLRIVTLLEKWLKSESHPTVDIDINDVEGVHVFEYAGTYGPGPTSDETEFTGVKVSVSERSIEFAYWDESSTEWEDVSIPAAEAINREVPQDIQNISKFYHTFYDFFTVEYSEQVDYFEDDGSISEERSTIHQIEQIFNRFSEIVIPLQERRAEREPLTMDDEADVQYLLHGLLNLYFDDVRRESHTERHSSVSPRIDFLVQDETIGIEVKRASPTRQEKELRKELSVDKEQYRLDTNIDTLLVFVYDPQKQIENKAEFEDSFNQETPQMDTRTTVTR